MAARGSARMPRHARTFNLSDMGVNFTSRSYGSTYIASIERDFRELDKSLVDMFDAVISRWQSRYNRYMPAMIRSATIPRTRSLSERMKLVRSGVSESGNKAQWDFSATSGDASLDNIGATLEGGRMKGGGSRAYFVPLASWMNEKGRIATTSAHIRADLSNSNTFWLKKRVQTASGSARMVLMYKDDYAAKLRAARAATTKKPRGRGRPPKVKSILKEIATAMYLVYDSSRAIFGQGRMTPKPKPIRSPLAAQFDLTTNNAAPEWFSRSAAIFLTLLYDAIGKVNVKLGARGAKVLSGSGEAAAQANAESDVIPADAALELKQEMIKGVDTLGLLDWGAEYTPGTAWRYQ